MPRNYSRRRNCTLTESFTFEELGKSGVWVDAELDFDFEPGEPMVRYYPDGSGYPGSPASCTYIGCRVTAAGGADWELKRSQRPDYFEALDRIIHNYILTHKLDDVETSALESHSERCYEQEYD